MPALCACPPPDWSKCSTVWLAGSVHVGHHERELVAFAREQREDLVRLDAAFVSVSLSEAGAEDAKRSEPERRALTYSKYNLLVRVLMKQIARKAGAPTDTTRDYEFTDWPVLDRFVGEIADRSH